MFSFLVLENQKILSDRIETCRSLRSSKDSGFCLGQETILLQRSSGTPDDWISNTYQLTLNTNRTYSSMWWFYAGDRMLVSKKGSYRGTFERICSTFTSGTWQIQISASDEVLLHHILLKKIEETSLRLPLWRPVRETDKIELSIEGDGYMTISDIALGN